MLNRCILLFISLAVTWISLTPVAEPIAAEGKKYDLLENTNVQRYDNLNANEAWLTAEKFQSTELSLSSSAGIAAPVLNRLDDLEQPSSIHSIYIVSDLELTPDPSDVWPPNPGDKLVGRFTLGNNGSQTVRLEGYGVRLRRNGSDYWDFLYPGSARDLRPGETVRFDQNNEAPLEAGHYRAEITWKIADEEWQVCCAIEFNVGSVGGGESYSISGQVIPGLGPGDSVCEISEATVTAYTRTAYSGGYKLDKYKSTMTDSNGYFTLVDLPAGTYSVYASMINCIGLALSSPVTGPPDITGLRIIAYRKIGSDVTGRVVDENGMPIAGVTIRSELPEDMGGHPPSTTTDSEGYYSVLVVTDDSTTITPSKSGYTFSPPFRTAIVPEDGTGLTGQDFVGTLVSASLLDPRIDAPNIQNWGEPTTLSRRHFVETFGGGICPADGGDCRLDPAAEEWYLMNFAEAGAGGYCYGMSLITTFFYRNIHTAREFDNDAIVPFNLTRPNRPLEEQMAIYQTFQHDLQIAQEITQGRRTLSPNEVLERIHVQLASDSQNPYIVAIFGQLLVITERWWGDETRWDGAGHALVPYRVEALNNNVHRVFVYDSNDPGEQNRYIEFDTQQNSWRYQMGEDFRPSGPVGEAGEWAGDASAASGYITLVRMSSHVIPRLPYHELVDPRFWIAIADTDRVANVVVSDRLDNRVGMVDGNLVDEMPNAIPIIPLQSDITPGRPSYYLPVDEYQILLGSSVISDTQTGLLLMGPSFAFATDSIVLSATSQNTITIEAEYPAFTFDSNHPGQEIDLVYIFSVTEGSAAGRTIELAGLELGHNNGINTRLDLSSGEVQVGNPGDDEKVYDVRIITADDTWSGNIATFAHRGLVVAPKTTHVLDLTNLDTTSTVMLTVIGSDGGVAEQLELNNNGSYPPDDGNIYVPTVTR